MAKRKLTEEQEKEIRLLQANNEMLERTKEEAKLRGKTDSIKRIELAQEDVISQIAKIDEETAILTANEYANNPIVIDNQNKVVNNNISAQKQVVTEEVKIITPIKEEPKINSSVFNTIPNDVQYDIISLPSNGECYKNKVGKIPVGYLTAYDENFLTSPNLYQDGLVIDFLLKNKILDKDFDIDNMCSGDADAVILFLRATSYGADFPISVREPKTQERFETVVDLTTFKSKDFKLKGDENGYFSYTLPVSKDEIKFKFLTRGEEKQLELLSEIESHNGNSVTIRQMANHLVTILSKDMYLSENEKKDIENSLDKISKWGAKYEEAGSPISKLITNRMEMSIVSVNGNSDKEYITNYVKRMPVRDSFMFRRYLAENEPGIDWRFTVDVPESLGGGSFETFLNWDDSIFFNIAEG